jgi:hypothetical protein
MTSNHRKRNPQSMNTHLPRQLIMPVLLGLAVLNSQLSAARAQGTAFTYQGHLSAGAGPADGTYDLTFSLFNASAGGSQVGATVTNLAVGVTNGLFTVITDFGAVFNGTPCWLQIGVRTNGGSAFSPLSPLQELTPTPYALYAPNAGTASTVVAGGISSVGIQAGSIMASNLNMASVSNALGNALGGSFWGLGGNAGTTAGVNFLGTMDDQPLQLRSYNQTGLQIQYVSRLTGTPPNYGSISSMNIVGGYGVNTVSNGVIGATIAGGGEASRNGTKVGWAANTVGGDYGAVGGGSGNTAGPNATVPGGSWNIAMGNGSFAAGRYAQTVNDGSFIWSDGSQDPFTSPGPNRFDVLATGGVSLQGGNVGIGTTSPNTLLEVTGDVRIDNHRLLVQSGSDTANGLEYLTSGLTGVPGGAAGPFLFGWNGGALGVANPTSVALSWTWEGNVWVSNNLSAASLAIDPNNFNLGNVYSNALTFGASSGEGITSKRSGTDPYDLEFFTDFDNRMTIAQGGNVGIHTTTPSETLEINGTSRLDDNDMYLRTGTDRNHGLGYRASIEGIATDGPFLYGWNGGALGTGNPDSISLKWDYTGSVWVSNNLSTASLTIRGGSDVAEPFPVTGSEVEPGTVMSIDEAHPGQLTRSTQAYDTRVAGIISGAGGINPGLSLQQDGVLDQGQKVALSGRVYVQADASLGAIKPGDLLTTSDVPGCAMKVSDHARAQGAILGKAMTGLKEGKGLVLVLVTLQ